MSGYPTRSKSNGCKKETNPNPTLFEYPADRTSLEPGRNVIIFTRHDHRQLPSPRFLNDTIISFFMQLHLDNKVSQELKSRIHVFNSFFFAKIKSIRDQKNGTPANYSCASRWLKGIKIFDKDFLIMPVCERDHWLLIIVCYLANEPSSKTYTIPDEELTEPAVIVLNSCNGLAPAIKKTLNQFLNYQWLKEHKTKRVFSIQNAKKHGIRLIFPELPQQKNNYDCGVYILNYFYCFLRNPRKAYIKMFRRHNMKTWFQDEKIDMSWERRKMATVIKNQISAWNQLVKDGSIKLEFQEIDLVSSSQSESSSIDEEVVTDDNIIVIN